MDSIIELRHLKTLLALEETGSVSLAAKRVFLTQSALSHQIRALENYYDTHLLPHDAQQQLASDPFVTTFSVNGNTVQFSLCYDVRLREYIYCLLLIDTKNAQPVLSNTDEVIEW